MPASPEPDESTTPTEPVTQATAGGLFGSWVGAVLAMLAIVAASAWVRIDYTLSNPHFDAESSAGFLTTDPAFITYGASRIVAGGGSAPDDFRADPRVEYPELTDMPAMFTVGQEYLIAWLHLALDGEMPLHVCAVWIMGILAALTALGVGLCTAELSGRLRWGVLAAALWAVLPASYRTLGFVVVREDLSLPIWALHLWFCARAARTQHARDFIGAGLLAAAAAATWHAMGSFLLMELVCLVLWFVRTGRSPLHAAGAWLAPASATLVALLIPVLRSKGFFVSTPLVIAWSLTLVGVLERRRSISRVVGLGAFAGAALVLFGAGLAITTALGTGGDYSHVGELLSAKLEHLGRRPLDPNVLTFDTRLMWQGPFNTAELPSFFFELGLALVALPIGLVTAVRVWLQGRGDARIAIGVLLLIMGLGSTWLIERTMVLPAIAGSAMMVAATLRLKRVELAVSASLVVLFCGGSLIAAEGANTTPTVPGQPPEGLGAYVQLLGLQGGLAIGLALALAAGIVALTTRRQTLAMALLILSVVGGEAWITQRYKVANDNVWYASPQLVTTQERAQLVRWIQRNIPQDEPILSDFLTSAGLLLQTGNPGLLQPKYETARSRRRIEAFFEHFFNGTPQSLGDWMREHRCQYLVLDRPWVRGNRNLAGLRLDAMDIQEDSPAGWMLHFQPQKFSQVPGFELLYGSAPNLRPGLAGQMFPPPGFVVYRLR